MIHKISSNIVYFVYGPFEFVLILKTCVPEESVPSHPFPSLIDGILRRSTAFPLFRGLVAGWLGRRKKDKIEVLFERKYFQVLRIPLVVVHVDWCENIFNK